MMELVERARGVPERWLPFVRRYLLETCDEDRSHFVAADYLTKVTVSWVSGSLVQRQALLIEAAELEEVAVFTKQGRTYIFPLGQVEFEVLEGAEPTNSKARVAELTKIMIPDTTPPEERAVLEVLWAYGPGRIHEAAAQLNMTTDALQEIFTKANIERRRLSHQSNSEPDFYHRHGLCRLRRPDDHCPHCKAETTPNPLD